MRCPITPELWQQYCDTGDVRVAEHLAGCATCRAEAAQFTHLGSSLASLPVRPVPAEVAARLQELEIATRGQVLTCHETMTLLEAWREGELPSVQAFLLEDHLLGCDPCSTALAQAETLTVALRGLPRIEVPSAVAERVALGRIPWWQRLLPSAPPSWSRQFSYAVATMAAIIFLVLSSLLRTPTVVNNPSKPAPSRIASIFPTLLPKTPAQQTGVPHTFVLPSHPQKPAIRSRINGEGVKPITSVVYHPSTISTTAAVALPLNNQATPAVDTESTDIQLASAVEPRIVRAKIDNDLTDTDNSRDACANDASLY